MVRLSSGSHWLARDLRKSVEMNLRKPQESGLACNQVDLLIIAAAKEACIDLVGKTYGKYHEHCWIVLKPHLKLSERGLDPVLFVLGDIQDCELIPSLHLRLSLNRNESKVEYCCRQCSSSNLALPGLRGILRGSLLLQACRLWDRVSSSSGSPEVAEVKIRKHKIKMRNLLIGASYGELAGPEELAVGLLPLAEPLDCPGKCVLYILTNLCPVKIKWLSGGKLGWPRSNISILIDAYKTKSINRPAPGLTVNGWLNGCLLLLTLPIIRHPCCHQILINRPLVPQKSSLSAETCFPTNPFSSKPVFSGAIPNLVTICKSFKRGVKTNEGLRY